MPNPSRETVVLTGASSGIGEALAREYVRRGAQVGLVARRSDRLEAIQRALRDLGGTVAVAPADVADRQALQRAIHQLEAELGPCDRLIANAGVSAPTGAEPMNVPGVAKMAEVNYLGAVYAFEAVLPRMLARGQGHLVGVASMAAYKGLPGAAGYCASKAALSTYCEALRIECWPRGVAVTCVYPGFVSTPMVAENEHPMPWIMSAERAAAIMADRLPGRPARLHFPYRMRLLMWLSQFAPDRFIRKRVPIKVAVHQTDRGTT